MDRFIETHKFQLGPHIAENVVPSLTVTDTLAVLRKQSRPDTSRPCVAFRMFQETEDEKDALFLEAVAAHSNGTMHSSSYLTSVATFMELPSSVYSYWVPKSISRLFSLYPPLDRDISRRPESPKIADAKQGLATGDNPRFVRHFWEVGSHVIARSREDTLSDRLWVPFALGGWLDVFQADIDNVIAWKDDGKTLRGYEGAAIRNDSFCFKEGISWHMAPQYPSLDPHAEKKA